MTETESKQCQLQATTNSGIRIFPSTSRKYLCEPGNIAEIPLTPTEHLGLEQHSQHQSDVRSTAGWQFIVAEIATSPDQKVTAVQREHKSRQSRDKQKQASTLNSRERQKRKSTRKMNLDRVSKHVDKEQTAAEVKNVSHSLNASPECMRVIHHSEENGQGPAESCFRSQCIEIFESRHPQERSRLEDRAMENEEFSQVPIVLTRKTILDRGVTLLAPSADSHLLAGSQAVASPSQPQKEVRVSSSQDITHQNLAFIGHAEDINGTEEDPSARNDVIRFSEATVVALQRDYSEKEVAVTQLECPNSQQDVTIVQPEHFDSQNHPAIIELKRLNSEKAAVIIALQRDLSKLQRLAQPKPSLIHMLEMESKLLTNTNISLQAKLAAMTNTILQHECTIKKLEEKTEEDEALINTLRAQIESSADQPPRQDLPTDVTIVQLEHPNAENYPAIIELERLNSEKAAVIIALKRDLSEKGDVIIELERLYFQKQAVISALERDLSEKVVATAPQLECLNSQKDEDITALQPDISEKAVAISSELERPNSEKGASTIGPSFRNEVVSTSETQVIIKAIGTINELRQILSEKAAEFSLNLPKAGIEEKAATNSSTQHLHRERAVETSTKDELRLCDTIVASVKRDKIVQGRDLQNHTIHKENDATKVNRLPGTTKEHSKRVNIQFVQIDEFEQFKRWTQGCVAQIVQAIESLSLRSGPQEEAQRADTELAFLRNLEGRERKDAEHSWRSYQRETSRFRDDRYILYKDSTNFTGVEGGEAPLDACWADREKEHRAEEERRKGILRDIPRMYERLHRETPPQDAPQKETVRNQQKQVERKSEEETPRRVQGPTAPAKGKLTEAKVTLQNHERKALPTARNPSTKVSRPPVKMEIPSSRTSKSSLSKPWQSQVEQKKSSGLPRPVSAGNSSKVSHPLHQAKGVLEAPTVRPQQRTYLKKAMQ
ncbi:hypothetical protein PROFUN_14568 [Planoprotostelium fungivorum]|uniref:Uncharacterized protein n=1 Tax=Planoprotostelium fungivorum TaxID=1890364 RepID=A0A2P6MZB9_9EUKA|nr:hypothetical protein PROFUN_14568 [Planoprotostelium fungivorum]